MVQSISGARLLMYVNVKTFGPQSAGQNKARKYSTFHTCLSHSAVSHLIVGWASTANPPTDIKQYTCLVQGRN